jgi:hypothetical protein
MTDPILDEVRRVREELIERHGGLENYLRYCEQQDRRRTRQGTEPAQPKRNRRQTAASRKLATKRN